MGEPTIGGSVSLSFDGVNCNLQCSLLMCCNVCAVD
jgi:hypothetical protein